MVADKKKRVMVVIIVLTIIFLFLFVLNSFFNITSVFSMKADEDDVDDELEGKIGIHGSYINIKAGDKNEINKRTYD